MRSSTFEDSDEEEGVTISKMADFRRIPTLEADHYRGSKTRTESTKKLDSGPPSKHSKSRDSSHRSSKITSTPESRGISSTRSTPEIRDTSKTRSPIEREDDSRPKLLTDQELETAKKKRLQEIQEFVRIIKKAEAVDLCFVVDCTGSMQPYINTVKDNILTLQSSLVRNLPYLDLRLGFVRYTDFDQGDTRSSNLPFTRDVRQFKNFVSKITAAGGGDAPEDVMGGLLMATDKMNWQGGTRVLIHIADAPCHGKQFHDQTDSYSSGDPHGVSEVQIMKKVADLSLQYWFGYINKSQTDKMITVFNRELKKVSSGQMEIKQFSAMGSTDLMEGVFNSVTASVAVSKSINLESKSLDSSREFKIDKAMPDWRLLEGSKVTQQTMTLKSDSLEEMIAEGYIPKRKATTITVRVANNPFAEGGVRVAYYGYVEEHDKVVVLKEYKKLGDRNNSLKRYLEDMDCQTVAAKFALDFEEKASIKLRFSPAKVVHFKHATKPKYMSIETNIEGKYQKFNGNHGYVAKIDDNDLLDELNAFSHWSWARSGRRLMIVDLQGVTTERGTLLTDPSIHAHDALRFGKTNLGLEGVRRFFLTHTCNDVCKRLGIVSCKT